MKLILGPSPHSKGETQAESLASPSRRQWLRSIVVVALGSLTLASLSRAKTSKKSKTLPLVNPESEPAASLHYVHDKKDLKDESLKISRSDVAFADQSCGNCVHYDPLGSVKGKPTGQCRLLSGYSVYEKAWCESWMKK